jgi:hypothetical protein
MCDIDNVYHTDIAYHTDICRSVYMFHTIFFTPVATHGHSPSDGMKHIGNTTLEQLQ